jgi:hypothetical protein
LWRKSRHLLGYLLRSNSGYTQPDKDTDVEKCVSRSVAGVLNATGARLRHSICALSSAKLAGQFMEVLQDEASSMNPEKATHCVLHQQDELGNFQHHEKLFGFPFSQDSCPGEVQLVVSLFKALLSRTRPSILDLHRDFDSLTHEYWVGHLSPQIHCLSNLFSPRRVKLRSVGVYIQMTIILSSKH